MANNNVPPTPTTSLPYFVPRIVMMATYTQGTQTPILLATITPCRLTGQHSIHLQLKQNLSKLINQLKLLHNKILKQFKQTLDLMIIWLLTLLTVLPLLIKNHKEHISNKCCSTKQRKQVSFPQDQQNFSELLDNNISTTEIRPILETYEQQLQTFQMSQTFETLATDCRAVNFSDTNQPVAQSVSYYNEIQPMSTQQKAAMAQAALINFFGESGTVTCIMNMVQPSHTQTLTELSNQPELNIWENQQGMSLTVSTHSYTIPHITHSRQTATDTTTQHNCNRQSYRVPQYYTDSHSYSNRRRVRRTNTHIHHKERKHPKKDDRK